MTYRDRRLAKADRLREWADKREAQGAADWEHGRAMMDLIPFGQPILAGHHSEGTDRRYRGRAWSAMDRGTESRHKAEAMRSRAANIKAAADGAIYSDDPDAIGRLEERVGELEAQRETIKADNAAYRKAHPELRALTAYQRSQAIPHPSYVLTNLTGNIKRYKDRLEVLRGQVGRQDAANTAGGVVVQDQGNGYVSVTFAEKPDAVVRDGLKSVGYYFKQGSWWGNADALPEGMTR